MGKITRVGAAGIVLLVGGCVQSASSQNSTTMQPHEARSVVVSSDSSGSLDRQSSAASFNGSWSVEWCDRSDPQLDCGGFSVTLVQEGERICGDYDGALVNLRQVDEGEIVGTVVGNVAVLSVESRRNNAISLVRAELRGEEIHWREVDSIKKGGADISVIATNDVMLPVSIKREQDPRRCGASIGTSRGE